MVPAMSGLGLGLDAGGTQTRWALAKPDGEIVAQGHVRGLTALQLGTEAGREGMRAALHEIATAAGEKPARVCAGMTGFSGGKELDEMLASAFGVDPSAIEVHGDVEIAYLDVFAPGAGYLLYAGTGSIAVYLAADGEAHRVGGHGGILDDAGSGFWIAVAALRHLWRAEDEAPGSAVASPMGREVFARLGGATWDDTRKFVYAGGFEANRGKVGTLAVGVGAAANEDPAAKAILAQAGAELARLGKILTARFGKRPVAVAGRVALLHPVIMETIRAELGDVEHRTTEAHLAAARIAAKRT